MMVLYIVSPAGTQEHLSGIPVEQVGVITVILGSTLIFRLPCRIGKYQKCIRRVLQVVVNMVSRCCGMQ